MGRVGASRDPRRWGVRGRRRKGAPASASPERKSAARLKGPTDAARRPEPPPLDSRRPIQWKLEVEGRDLGRYHPSRTKREGVRDVARSDEVLGLIILLRMRHTKEFRGSCHGPRVDPVLLGGWGSRIMEGG